MLCFDFDRYDWSSDVLVDFGANSSHTEEYANEFMGNLAHTAEETFMFCFVRRILVPCLEIFETVKTDSGNFLTNEKKVFSMSSVLI